MAIAAPKQVAVRCKERHNRRADLPHPPSTATTTTTAPSWVAVAGVIEAYSVLFDWAAYLNPKIDYSVQVRRWFDLSVLMPERHRRKTQAIYRKWFGPSDSFRDAQPSHIFSRIWDDRGMATRALQGLTRVQGQESTHRSPPNWEGRATIQMFASSARASAN